VPDVLIPFLTPEWFEKINTEAGEVPRSEGINGIVDMAIKRGTGVTATVTITISDGQPTFSLGPDPDADVTLQYLEEDLPDALVGQLDSIAAFAMGRIGVTGDIEGAADVMILWDGESYRAFRRRLVRTAPGALVDEPCRAPDPLPVLAATTEAVQGGGDHDAVVGIDEGLCRPHAVVPERHRAPVAEVARRHHHAEAVVADALAHHRLRGLGAHESVPATGDGLA
jgi:putative sterol carrier protein